MERKIVQSISAIVLTHNEEDRIEACLSSLAWVDEIIIVDQASTDDTIKRAKLFSSKVVHSTQVDFSELRNAGKDAAANKWLLYIDADEAVTPELCDEITSAVKNESINAFWIPRINYFYGKRWPNNERFVRLMRKTALIGWKGPIHESALVVGRIDEINEPLLHNTHRNLEEMLIKTNKWSEIEALLRIKISHPPIVQWRLFRVMMTSFWNSLIHQQSWKMGTLGLIESIYQAFSMFVTYAKAWEIQSKIKI